MTPDLILVAGIVVGVFSVPAIISAISDRRPPRAAALVLIAAGCLTVWAARQNPGGYSLNDVPHAFVRVIGQVIR